MIVVFSVIFQKNLKFFKSFLDSLKKQSDRDFKLFLVNDGVNNLETYLQPYDIDIDIYNVYKLTPFEIRVISLGEIVKKYNRFDYIIFADTDDIMQPERIEVTKSYLKKYPFVCNDLSLMAENGFVFRESIWDARLHDEFEFNYDFLSDKNIIGFGNSGMNVNLLPAALEKLKGVKHGDDWLFFSSIGVSFKSIFTKKCVTFYRQHENNTIGRKLLSETGLLKILEKKINHYSLLKSLNVKSYDVDKFKNNNELLLNYLKKSEIETERHTRLINLMSINFFWWEESNFIKK